MSSTKSAEAGWFQDPNDPSALRYWDGAAWTEHTVPAPLPGPAQQRPRLRRRHYVAGSAVVVGMLIFFTGYMYPFFVGAGSRGTGFVITVISIAVLIGALILGVLNVLRAGREGLDRTADIVILAVAVLCLFLTFPVLVMWALNPSIAGGS